MSWQARKLGEFISIKHGWAFKGEYFSDAGKYILLTPGNAYETGGLKLRPGKEKFYLGDFPSDYLMKSGDMLVVMTDLIQAAPILGGVIVVPEDDRFLHNQRLGLVEFLSDAGMDKGFLYYLLNSPDYRAQVRGSATGATVRHTAPKRICNCDVLVPDTMEEQRQVARVLSAYDDLIATNQRRIALLEGAARRLYREWFIHLRFPGHESAPMKDGVPEGWQHSTFADLVQINPRTPFIKQIERPFIEMSVLSETSMVMGHPSMRVIGGGAKFKNGDTLFARITPCTENGKTGFVQFLENEDEVASGSTEFIVLRSATVNPWWVYCMAREDNFREHAIRSMAGSDGRQRVNPKCFDQLTALQPPQSVLAQFEQAVKDSFTQIETLCKLNEQLGRARDRLLPKLMSGQLDVSGIRLPEEITA
jgi:type I restriction enzyme S subunit